MKILSRDFTTREKVLLIILTTLLLCLCYYHFVDQPIRTAVTEANAQIEEDEIVLMAVNTKVKKLQKMQDELDEILNDPSVSVMPSYNNVKEEREMLNGILATYANTYSISFEDAVATGDQVRRDVVLQFTASSYDQVKSILSELSSSKDRCLLNDVVVTSTDKDVANYDVNCSVSMTFYETMVEGKTDAGLIVAEQ